MSDGNYNGACTNWYGVDIDQIYAMLEHEGSNESWSQVSAYGQTYELLAYHSSELKKMRDQLATEWQSPAASVFGGYIDRMLASMKDVGDAAVDNMSGLTNINSALTSARTDIGKLREQWHANKGKEEDSKIFGVDVPLVSDAIAGLPDNWQEEIKSQVATRMSIADRDVAEGTTKMTVPPTFLPPAESGESTTTTGNGAGGSGAGSGSGSSGATGPTRYPGTESAPYVPPPAAPPSESLVYDDGAWLAGNPTTIAPGSGIGGVGPGGVIGTIPGGSGGGGLGSNNLGTGLTAGLIGGGLATSLINGVSGNGTNLIGTRPTGLTGGVKPGMTPTHTAGGPRSAPMPPGGVLGGARGGGPSGAAAPKMGGATSSGGVIHGARGGQPGSGGRAGAAGQAGGAAATRGATPAMATSAGGRRGGEHEDERPGFDPDNPWAVEEGGPEIIVPSAPPKSHDPGPGVIGIDR